MGCGSSWMPMVSQQGFKWIKRTTDSLLKCICAFEMVLYWFLWTWSVARSIWASLQLVGSVSASDRQIETCIPLLGVMFAALYAPSFPGVLIWARFFVNMHLGPVALVPTSCNSCPSWCWNNLLRTLHLTSVTWWIHAPTAQLPSDDHHLTIWLPPVRLNSGTPDITYILLWRHSQPHPQGTSLQHESHEHFIPITDLIALLTTHLV